MALEDKELPEGFQPDERVVQLVSERLTDGKLACASAFAIATALSVPPLTVGRTADLLGIHLTRCQLGLFGYPGKQGWTQENAAGLAVPSGLIEAIEQARSDTGNLACARAWEIAWQFKVSRMQVGYLADQLGIHISPCQLGAF